MNTLVIMAKHPVAGMVKTRLAASLGEAAAAGLDIEPEDVEVSDGLGAEAAE